MKSVPEQVWYSKALPVGDGSLTLRKLRNVALASRRLVGAGWTRSGRIVPVDDSVAPASSSTTTKTTKNKRWCGCLCRSNGGDDSAARRYAVPAAEAASDSDESDAAGVSWTNALASSGVKQGGGSQVVPMGGGMLSRVTVEMSDDVASPWVATAVVSRCRCCLRCRS